MDLSEKIASGRDRICAPGTDFAASSRALAETSQIAATSQNSLCCMAATKPRPIRPYPTIPARNLRFVILVI